MLNLVSKAQKSLNKNIIYEAYFAKNAGIWVVFGGKRN